MGNRDRRIMPFKVVLTEANQWTQPQREVQPAHHIRGQPKLLVPEPNTKARRTDLRSRDTASMKGEGGRWVG